MFIDPATQQSIPYSAGSYKASHTWTNPNTTSTPFIGPSAMVVQSYSQGKATTSWIPDSGASLHIIGESLNIKQMQYFDGPDKIFIGNGAGLSISGAGSFLFESPFDSRVLFKLNHLLHVPSVMKNLLSASQFTKDNSVF